MKKLCLCLPVLLLLSFAATAQWIKKPPPKRLPTHADSVYVNEHFRQDNLDSVYRYFNRLYHVNIVYDTPYCRRRKLDYWYMHTQLTQAIEITTRDNGLMMKYDTLDANTVYIKRNGRIKDDGTRLEMPPPPPQVKFFGPPVRKAFTLSGKVIDYTTGEALPYSTIHVAGSKDVITTNAEGLFTILRLESDTVTINAAAMGYVPTDVYLNPGISADNFIIELLPGSNVLQEAIITANRNELAKFSGEAISMIKMSPQKLAALPNVGEKDIMRSLQLMPGVSAANESSSGLYVRGGTPDQNLVVYDGFTIYQVDHLYGFFSAFNPNALKDMQLYKGGFEAKYGGRLSSVTEITGKEGNKKQTNIGGDLSFLSGNLFAEIPLSDKITIVAAGRKSWKGPIYNWIFNKFNKSDNNSSETTTTGGGPRGPVTPETKTTSYFNDVNTRITYRPTEKDNISYSFFNSLDKLDNSQSLGLPGGMFGGGSFNSGNNNNTDLTRYGNTGMSVKWARQWSQKLNSSTIASYSNYFSLRNRTNERTYTDSTDSTYTTTTGIVEKNNLKDLSFKNDWEWNALTGNQLGFGLFGTYYDIAYSYNQNDTADVLSRQDYGGLLGAYLQDRISMLHNKVELKPGVRASYFTPTAKTYIEPRFAFSWKPTESFAFKAAYGQYYQFANRITREDVLDGNRDFWILSNNSNIPVGKATHYIAGVSYETKDYLFSAETYYKQLDNISEYSLRFSNISRNSPTTYSENFYSGYGYAKGIEFLLQKKTGKFNGWVSYTLGEARNHFDVYGDGYVYANQDVTHEFKAVGIYKYKKWDFSATWIYATGRPYTAPGGSYTVTLLDGTTKDYFTVTSKNSMRLPDYHRLDLAVNRRFYNESGREIGYIGLSLFNAYNHTNVWYKQFYISGSQITEVNVNYLGITPNLTISLKMR